jgi:hypothetical protein
MLEYSGCSLLTTMNTVYKDQRYNKNHNVVTIFNKIFPCATKQKLTRQSTHIGTP